MNNDGTNPRRDGEEPQAPPRLAAALKESPARRVFVPPSIDRSVLDASRRHLTKPQRSGWASFRSQFFRPSLAVACIVLTALAFLLIHRTDTPAQFAREDINRDGHVDILDAFQLTRELKSGSSWPAAWDLNGDGKVDLRDAELVATRAVTLGKGNPS
jgi:hypothetical protein